MRATAIDSGRIINIQAPARSAPTIQGGEAIFNANQTSKMHVEDTVRFNVAAADPRAGWDVGWVQAQWVETNSAYYRGQFEREGSIFLQAGRGPARPQQACRDISRP